VKRVYTAEGPLEGTLMRDLLAASGIRAELYEKVVWIVHDSDEARAVRIVSRTSIAPQQLLVKKSA
jgi:hypothetical protein